MQMLNLPLRLKMPLLFALIMVLVLVPLTWLNYNEQRNGIIPVYLEQNEMSVELRTARIGAWIELAEAETRRLAQTSKAVQATFRFISVYDFMGENASNLIRTAYIDNNPFPFEDRDQLETVEGETGYFMFHSDYHAFFRDFLAEIRAYDAFIISPDGDIVYTVKKEDDFGTSVLTGVASRSGLKTVFEQVVAENGPQVAFSDFVPYGPSSGALAAFIATPVRSDNGTITGVIAIQLSSDALEEIVPGGVGLHPLSDIFLVGSDGKTRTPSRFEGRLEASALYPDRSVIDDALAQETTTRFDAMLSNSDVGLISARRLRLDQTDWVVVIETPNKAMEAEVIAVRNRSIILAIIFIAISAVFGVLLSRSIVKPIGKVKDIIEDFRNGQLDPRQDAAPGRDEIGQIFAALEVLRVRLADAVQLHAQTEDKARLQSDAVDHFSKALNEVAAGNLKAETAFDFPAEFNSLDVNFRNMVASLKTLVIEVSETSRALNGQADSLAGSADDLSRRTEMQAATLEQTAAALDEITTSTTSAAKGARHVETIVNEAKVQAAASEEVVGRAVAAMGKIESSAEQISQIINVMEDIAFQTSLLALNAGVEAARAGDVGKGFAVVASEVRVLAQRSSDAAKQVRSLISESTRNVEDGVSEVGQAGTALTTIAQRVGEISELVSGIARAADEQATALSEVNQGMVQLDRVTQQNAGMVEATTTSVRALKEKSVDLDRSIARFRVDLPPVRAAARPVETAPRVAAKPAATRNATATRAVASRPPAPRPDTPRPEAKMTGTTGTDTIWQDF